MEKKTTKSTEKKSNRGGARIGAGRKDAKIKTDNICFKCSPEEHQKIKKLAEKENKSISEFILNNCLK